MPAHSGSAGGTQGGNNWMAGAEAPDNKPPRTPSAAPDPAGEWESRESAQPAVAAPAAMAAMAAATQRTEPLRKRHRPAQGRAGWVMHRAGSQAAAQKGA